MMPAKAIKALVRRDRSVVAAALAAIVTLSWLYLFYLGAGMRDLGSIQTMAMPALEPWSGTDAFMMFVMWAVMMAAMMIPSAAPMILLHAAIVRKRNDGQPPGATISAFAAGYLTIWTGFSALATVTQWSLEQAALLSPMMVSTSPYLGATILMAAGLYQMTYLKEACLQHCRSPIHFLSAHWRTGTSGAFRMGLDHGFYCVGCCWVLMSLLFVGGVMNFLWIATLSVFVLVEKIAPRGIVVGRIGGGLMILASLWLILQL